MAERPDYLIAGAGPAGALLARLLADDGYRVAVIDPSPRPGTKPCGWAVPAEIESIYSIPGDAVITRIRGYRVYLSGRLVFEERGRHWGYIVDKPRMLEKLLEGIPLHRRGLRLAEGFNPKPPAGLEPRRSVVVATGSQAYAGRMRDMIYAVQTLLPWSDSFEEDLVEFHFDPSLVGYYWVFPRPPRWIDVGVGGYEKPMKLIERLHSFITERLKGRIRREDVKGAWINVSGAQPQLLTSNPPVIGEAAGYVYPLTGEGIRPSMVSALAYYETAIRGRGDPKLHRTTVKWINIQRRIVDRALKSSPESRAALLESMPPDLFVSLGLGSLPLTKALKLAARLPRGIARIIAETLKPQPLKRQRGGGEE
ncbi:MAG: NAD(P)/FAD-dependent oxidoreductase [Crenarchaeota archaeon]|nr:NAD(P)/FAD-dependent oxidoreductase [Thermoproteota archaeon]